MFDFEYQGTVTFEKTVTVESLGNLALKTQYSDGSEFYLVVLSDMGMARIYQLGPIYAGLDNNVDGEEFEFSMKKIKFNQHKIEHEIEMFLGKRRDKARIEDAEEVQLLEVFDILPDLHPLFGPRD